MVTWYDVIDDVIKTRKTHISRRKQCGGTKVCESCLVGKEDVTTWSRGMTSSMTSLKLQKITSQKENTARTPNVVTEVQGQGRCHPLIGQYDVINDVIKTRKRHISGKNAIRTPYFVKVGPEQCWELRFQAVPKSIYQGCLIAKHKVLCNVGKHDFIFAIQQYIAAFLKKNGKLFLVIRCTMECGLLLC